VKSLLLLLALISSLAFADECAVNQAVQVVSTSKVGEVTDLVKDITPNKCVVKYRINVNKEWHTVTWTHTGNEDGEFLCNTAIENGRKQLLTVLGGTIESETITVCKSNQNVKFKPVKIGDEVVEAELGRVPERNKYFKYNNATCRMFREKYNNGVLRVNHGVICQTDNKFWTVVDKW
jgi:hypothetical protein